MRLVGNLLFGGRELRDLRNRKLAEMSDELYALDENRILNTDSDEVMKYFRDKYDIDVPKLDIDNTEIDKKETDLGPHRLPRIRGTIVEYHIPFSGDKELFQYRPSSYSGEPTAIVMEGELTISIEFGAEDADHEKVGKKYEQELKKVEKYLEWQRNDVTQFREELQSKARILLDSRKKKLLADQEILVKIDKPIRRANAPSTYSVPKIRKTIELPKQSKSASPQAIEWSLDIQVYEHILSVLENMVAVMEYSPRAFSNLDEEALRFHFLVQLNGQYEGTATAETFNFTGKTDIIIKEGGKNIFVAECKFWRGPQALIDTIDQILGYLTWRDTKAAIVLFNKNRGFSQVLKKIPDTVREHLCFDRQLDYDSDRGFRFEMHKSDDPEKKLLLTVMAFDIPSLDEA